jgi:hypothetical protein
MLTASHSPQLRGIINLLKDVPPELINLTSANYADLVLATSTIEETLETWISRGRLIPLSQVLPHLAFEEGHTRSGACAGVFRAA